MPDSRDSRPNDLYFLPSSSLLTSNMSSFLPVKPCCVTHPGELPGTPRGSMEPARQGKMGRYIVKPDGPVKNEKAALILLYDAMGFQAVGQRY